MFDPAGLGLGALAGAAAVERLRVRRLARRMHDVALCSHELRGALTTMGLALERGGVAGDRGRMIALREGFERAEAVARDLEAARGALPAVPVPRPETFDLQEVAGRVVAGWNSSPPGRGEPATLDWRAGTVLIEGYPVRLAQALHNLIANADEHGGGRVTVLGRRAGGYVSIAVLDRGAGLLRSLDELRPRPWHARRGHGLIVARHAVELHGGTLQAVRGALGSGVEIRLPVSGSPATGAGRGSPVPGRSGPATVGR